MPETTETQGKYGIEATQGFFDGIGRSAILGYFVAHDGLGFDDIAKMVNSIPEVTEIFGDFSQAPQMALEMGDLTLLEIADLNVYQAQTFKNIALAIHRIKETGTYKEIRSAKRAA